MSIIMNPSINITKCLLLFTLGSLITASSILSAKEYTLTEYEIRWAGSMPAKTHEGLLSLASLQANISDSGKVNSLSAVVDMSSINVTDLKGDDRDTLTEHLKSDDFFHVEKYPVATFELQEHKDNQLHGTITIREVSKDISIPVRVSGDPNRGWMLVGDFEYNRKKFGVDYQNSGFLGLFNAAKSKLIRDAIDVSISLTLTPETAQQ